MKYQVYLNKETSDLINRIASNRGIKPNTQIKQLIEAIAKETLKVYEKNEKSFEERHK